MVEEEDSLATALELFVESGIEELPVVRRDDPAEPIGTIWHQDVMAAYNRQVFQKDMASGFAQKMTSSVEQARPVQVISGYSILECNVPEFLIGKEVKNSGLREQHGIDLILVSKPQAEGAQHISSRPGPDYRFEAGDRVIVFGETPNVRRFSGYTR